jgi:hypothetical protein
MNGRRTWYDFTLYNSSYTCLFLLLHPFLNIRLNSQDVLYLGTDWYISSAWIKMFWKLMYACIYLSNDVMQRHARTFACRLEILMRIRISSYSCCTCALIHVRITTGCRWVGHELLESWSWHSLHFQLPFKIRPLYEHETNITVHSRNYLNCFTKVDSSTLVGSSINWKQNKAWYFHTTQKLQMPKIIEGNEQGKPMREPQPWSNYSIHNIRWDKINDELSSLNIRIYGWTEWCMGCHQILNQTWYFWKVENMINAKTKSNNLILDIWIWN